MRTYLEEVGAQSRLELFEAMAHADMVDESNQAFGGPPGRAGPVAHVKGFRRSIGELQVRVDRIVAADNAVMAWWLFFRASHEPLARAAAHGSCHPGHGVQLVRSGGRPHQPVPALSPCRVSRARHLGHVAPAYRLAAITRGESSSGCFWRLPKPQRSIGCSERVATRSILHGLVHS